MSEWPVVPLGECVMRCRNGLAYKNQFTPLGLPIARIQTIADGAIDFGKVGYAGIEVPPDSEHLLKGGDILFSHKNSLAHVGKVAIYQPAMPPLVHGDNLLRLTANATVLPEYLFICLQSGAFRDQVRSRSQKAVNQVSINTAQLRAIPMPRPPVQDQRRIVDLVGGVDTQIEAMAAVAEASAAMQGPLMEALVVGSGEGFDTLPLGEVGEFIRGRRFTKEEYVPAGLGCIHYGQVHSHFRPVARQSLTFLPEESRGRLRLARHGDVVIAATSEDLEGLGKATVWLGDDDVAVHDDCYIFRHRLDPKFASYLFLSPWFQQEKRRYAGGTKVTRISGSDLAGVNVPIPPLTVQVRIGEALHELSAHGDAVLAEVAALRSLRASLVTALLSRRVEIAESYDALLPSPDELPLVTP